MKGENRLLKQSELPAAGEGRPLRALLKGALCEEMGGRGIIFHKIGDVGEPLPPMLSHRDKPHRAWSQSVRDLVMASRVFQPDFFNDGPW
jgi:hypothetical protein